MRLWALGAALAVPMLIGTVQQTSNPRAGWPCGARLDPAYFQVAEGSGGHLLMLAPEEIADSASLLTAFGSHPQTLFRLAGSLKAGVHDLEVPIDATIESVVFSISVQCLQVAQVLRPSGVPVSGEGVVDLSNFRAQRLVTVRKPEPGLWTLAVSGSGVSGVVVQARSGIGIAQVEFAPVGSTTFSALPSAGVENEVRIRMSGTVSDLVASIVRGDIQTIAELPRVGGSEDGLYVSRFVPPPRGFRVLVRGKDAEGLPFQRLHAPLLSTRR